MARPEGGTGKSHKKKKAQWSQVEIEKLQGDWEWNLFQDWRVDLRICRRQDEAVFPQHLSQGPTVEWKVEGMAFSHSTLRAHCAPSICCSWRQIVRSGLSLVPSAQSEAGRVGPNKHTWRAESSWVSSLIKNCFNFFLNRNMLNAKLLTLML